MNEKGRYGGIVLELFVCIFREPCQTSDLTGGVIYLSWSLFFRTAGHSLFSVLYKLNQNLNQNKQLHSLMLALSPTNESSRPYLRKNNIFKSVLSFILIFIDVPMMSSFFNFHGELWIMLYPRHNYRSVLILTYPGAYEGGAEPPDLLALRPYACPPVKEFFIISL